MKKLADILVNGQPADDLTLEARNGKILVHGWGVHTYGTLEGKPLKQYLDSFDTVEEALEEYPEARSSHPELQPNLC